MNKWRIGLHIKKYIYIYRNNIKGLILIWADILFKMDDLEKVTKLRDTSGTLDTKLITKIETTLNEEVKEITKSSLWVFLEQLNVKCELLKKYDSEIERLISEEGELEDEIVAAQKCQDKVIRCKCLI